MSTEPNPDNSSKEQEPPQPSLDEQLAKALAKSPQSSDPKDAEEVLKMFRDIMKGCDQEQLKAALKNRTKPRPEGTKSASNYPYYKQRYAIELKIILDEMIEEFQRGELTPRIFFYKNQPHLSPHSVYVKINQSLLYLTQKLDPDGKYALFLSRLDIERKKNVGIRFDYADPLGATKDKSLVASVSKVESKDFDYESKIESFLTNPDRKELHVKNLALTSEQVASVEQSLMGLDLIYDIKPEYIKIVKLDGLTDEQRKVLGI